MNLNLQRALYLGAAIGSAIMTWRILRSGDEGREVLPTLLPGPESKVVQAWTAGRASVMTVVKVESGRFLEQAAANAYLQMKAAATQDGIALQLNSAWRSWAEQVLLYSLYKLGKGNLAAQPGYSNHQNGIAMDIDTTKGAFEWLTANAERFGIIRTVSTEKWHWEYRPGQAKYIA